jgi:hypothetical protein
MSRHMGAGGKAGEAAKRALAVIDEAHGRARVLNQWQAIVQNHALAGHGAMGRMGARIAGGVAGAAVGGPLGGAGGAALGNAAMAAFDPGQRLRVLAAVDRLATRVDDRVRQSVSRFVSRAVRRATDTARSTATQSIARLASREAFDERMRQLQEARTSDVALREQLSMATRELDSDAPQIRDAMHTAALRGVGFLSARAPTPTGMSGTILPGVQSKPRYLEQDRIRFMRYARTVDDPLTVLDDLEKRRLAREGVEAIREVYPSLYQSIVREVMTQIAARSAKGDPMPYGDRIQLGLLLGTTTDPTLEPEFLQMFQRTFQLPSQTEQRSPGSSRGESRLGRLMASQSQSLEARRASS